MRIQRPWLTLVSVTLGLMMVGLNGTIVAIALPSIARHLHASFSDLQWVTNAYLLAVAVTVVIGGQLGDRFGRRLIFLIGVVGFALASVACGLTGSIEGLIAFRAVQGLFGALLLPSTISLLRAAFPPEQLNTALGIWGGGSAISVAAGPIVGGLLVQHVSWQWVFYVNVPVGIVALAIGALVLVESRDPNGSTFDPPGILTLAIGLFAVIFGIIEAGSWGWTSGRTLGCIIGGVAVLGLFVLTENRVKAPLIPLKLFRSSILSVSAVVLLLSFLALFATLFFLTLYLQNVVGYSPVDAGVRLLALSALFMVSAPIGGVLNQRFGPRLLMPFSMLLVGAGILSFTRISASSSYLHLWPGLVATGLGIGMVTVCASDGIVAGTPVDEAGIAGGITATAQELGAVIGTSLLGTLLASRASSSLVAKLVGAGIPSAAARELANNGTVKKLVGQGIAPPVPGLPKPALQAVAVGAHNAFVSGLHLAMLLAACACFLAVLVSLVFLSFKPNVDSPVETQSVKSDEVSLRV